MFIIHKHQINTAIRKNYLAFKAQLLIDELVPICLADFKSHFSFILFEKGMETNVYFWNTLFLQGFQYKTNLIIPPLRKYAPPPIWNKKHVIPNFQRTSATIFQIFPPTEDVH